MEKRTIKGRKKDARHARPYDRPNQGLVGKVASKIKGLFNPSWIFNVSQWMSAPAEEEEPARPAEPTDEVYSAEQDVRTRPVAPRGSKRPRLRLNDHSPPIHSEATQTWLNSPSSSNMFNEPPRLPLPVPPRNLIENRESVALNGDDHSENSEASSTTSGCSSLVSSHKERICPDLRLGESSLGNLRGNLKGVISNSQREVSSPKDTASSNASTSRNSLWSGSGGFSPAAKFQRRTPSVVNSSTQPSFNVGAFVGPSKLNQPQSPQLASPFYQGRTSFGGASAVRKMPVRAAPYLVERQSRNHLKVRAAQQEDNLEGMSSAAKRILHMLEKMSSPVTDAKKISNTDRSAADISLYMMPPKHHTNQRSTQSTVRGPPIANISAISKLTTLKSSEPRKIQSHPEPLEPFLLPDVPLPITTLPSFNFETPSSQSSAAKGGRDFVFSSPIEVLPSSALPPLESEASSVPSKPGWECSSCYHINSTDKQKCSACGIHRPTTNSSTDFNFQVPSVLPFDNGMFSPSNKDSSSFIKPLSTQDKKSNPVTFGISNSSSLSTSNPLLSRNSDNKQINASVATSSAWECPECWVRNSSDKSKCSACETPKISQNATGSIKAQTSGSSIFGKPVSDKETPKISLSATDSIKTQMLGSSIFGKQVSDEEESDLEIIGEIPLTKVMKSTFQPPASKSSTFKFGDKVIDITDDNEPSDSLKTESLAGKVGGSQRVPGFDFKMPKAAGITSNHISEKPASTDATTAPAPMFTFASPANGDIKYPKLSSQSTASNFNFQVPPVLSPTHSPLAGNQNSKEQSKISTTSASVSKPTWECPECWVRNSIDKSKCSACETPNPSQKTVSGVNAQTPTSIFGKEVPDKDDDVEIIEISSSEKPLTSAFSIPKSSASNFKFGDKVINITDTPFGENKSSKLKVSDSLKRDSLKEKTTDSRSSAGFHFKMPAAPPLMSNHISATPLSTDATTAPAAMFKFGDKTDVPKITAGLAGTNWECTTCLVRNSPDKLKCAACESPKPSSDKASTSSNSISILKASTASTETAFKTLTSTGTSLGGNKNIGVPGSSEQSIPSFTTPFVPSSVSAPPVNNKAKDSTSNLSSSNSLFKFGASAEVKTSHVDSSEKQWRCTSCLANNDSDLLKCSACCAAKTQATGTFGQSSATLSQGSAFSLPSSCTPVFKFGDKAEPVKPVESVFSTSVLPASATPAVPVFGSFGTGKLPSTTASSAKTTTVVTATTSTVVSQSHFAASNAPTQEVKAVSTVAPSNTFAFGNPNSQPAAGSGFSFFSSAAVSTPASTAGFAFGSTSTNETKTSEAFTFKGASSEKPNPVSSGFDATTATSTANSVFKFGSSAIVPTTKASSSFSFGSGATSAGSASGFTTFQANAAPAPVFQFGQSSANSSAPTGFGAETPGKQAALPAFGASTGVFMFGNKTDAGSQVTNSTPQAPAFPPAQFGFGASPAAPAFGKTEKPAFNFGAASSSAPVFQFGNADKKQATAPAFAFGTQSNETPAASSFTQQFNPNTPPTFNFSAGASSTPGGPFQFAASSEQAGRSSGTRKIKKAYRRMK